MFTNHRLRTLILIIIYCVTITACGLLDAPKQWLIRDENPREPSSLINLETEKVKVQSVWRNSVGDLEPAYNKIRPYITGNRVYLSDAEGRVEAWQREDGKRIWSITIKEKISGGVNGGEGIIAVGAENGLVIALNQVDGAEQWRTLVSSEVMALSEVKYGVIVARTNDGKVHALDIGNGNVAWKAGRNTPALSLRGASEPKVVGDIVLVGYDDGKMTALKMHNGEELWEIAVSVPSGRSELERMSDIDGEIAYSDGIIYAVSFNGRVIAVDLGTGQALWTKDLSSSAGVSVDEARVYVTDTDDSVWALDKTSGVTLWRQDQLLYRVLTAAKPVGDYVVVGDYQGYLHWLSKQDGKLAGRENVSGGAIQTPPMIIKDRIYALANNGSLTVLQYR